MFDADDAGPFKTYIARDRPGQGLAKVSNEIDMQWLGDAGAAPASNPQPPGMPGRRGPFGNRPNFGPPPNFPPPNFPRRPGGP
jgi:hypothetical protein